MCIYVVECVDVCKPTRDDCRDEVGRRQKLQELIVHALLAVPLMCFPMLGGGAYLVCHVMACVQMQMSM